MFKRNILKYVLVFSSIALFLIVGLYYYNNILGEKLSVSTCQTLEEILGQQAFNFSTQLIAEQEDLELIAILISEYKNIHHVPLEILKESIKKTHFQFLTLVDLEGNSINQNGTEFNLYNREYIQEALTGKIVFSQPLESKYENNYILAIALPLWAENKVIGLLVGSFNVEVLNTFIQSSFNGRGFAYVVDSNGKILARTSNIFLLLTDNNLFKIFESVEFYNYDTFEELKTNLSSHVSGHTQYIFENNKYLVHYSPLAINDWSIFSIVVEEIINQQTNSVLTYSKMLTLAVLVFFILLVAFIFAILKFNLEKVSNIAYLDSLTGLYTLAKFKLEAKNILDKNPEKNFILHKFDVENFKYLNQILGFKAGDQVLKNIAKALQKTFFGSCEIVARVNGDEFLLFSPYESKITEALTHKKFLELFYELMGKDFIYTTSFPTGKYLHFHGNFQSDINEMLEKVNFAHRHAKKNKLSECVFDEQLTQEVMVNKDLEQKMQPALENHEFVVYLQPKYSLVGEHIVGAEALIRWQRPDGLLFPNSFIPLFESNGFITKLDMYVFEEVCILLQKWIEVGLSPVPVSVNFSRLHMLNITFVSQLCAIANKYHVPLDFLEIELTETVIFDHEEILINMLHQLHSAGFTFSMDDFGTGYSSLGLLKNLAIDVIKIDKVFFNTAQNREREKIVLTNILRMAQELNILTVAEGVETQAHIDLLRELGCHYVQGYYYAKPMPAGEFTLLLEKT